MLRLLFFCLICCTSLAVLLHAEDNGDSTAVEGTEHLRFRAKEILIYNYQSEQTTLQEIGTDKITVKSTIAWQFALKCLSSDEQTAQLRLSILIVKASIEAPGFKHRIDTSIPDKQLQVPLIGHLTLLNGKTFDFTYDYSKQRLTAVSGAEQLQAAFRKVYPAPEFDDEPDDPRFEQIKRQYSNEALLRLWREIIRPPGHGAETAELAEPVKLSIQRDWEASEGANSYKLKSNGGAGKAVTLNVGPNPVQARLDSLSGSGSLRLEDGRLAESKGALTATFEFEALTQAIKQELSCNWALILVKQQAASE